MSTSVQPPAAGISAPASTYLDALRARLDQSMELAVTDQLTGLHNRRYMESQLAAQQRAAADAAKQQQRALEDERAAAAQAAAGTRPPALPPLPPARAHAEPTLAFARSQRHPCH